MNSSRIAACIVALVMGGLAGPAQARVENDHQAEVLLQESQHRALVDGDLEQAIELCKKILTEHSGNRPVVAKALLQMGGCYEKLGRAEARMAYERVINEYGDRKEEVAVATERMASLEQNMAALNRKPTFRKIKIASNPQNGVLSPDGNRLATFSDGSVWIIPLHGNVNPEIAGEPIQLAKIPRGFDNGTLMSWSADGKWIAVNAMDTEDKNNEIEIGYIIPVDGGKPRLVEMIPRGNYAFNRRLGLSHDGDMVTFSALELGKTESYPLDRSIYTIPTLGGQPVQVISGMSNMPSYSPNDEFIAYIGYSRKNNDPDNDEMPNGNLWLVSAKNGKPVKLSNVNGRLSGPIWSPDGKYIAAHHQPGGDSDSKEIWVFSLSPDASSAGEPQKIALPRSSWNMLAGWTPDNELGIFIQSERRSAIYTVPSIGGKAMQVSPDVGPNYPAWSPDGKRIYFREWTEKEGVEIHFVPANGGKTTKVPVQTKEDLSSSIPGGGHTISPDGQKILISAGTIRNRANKSNLFAITLESGLPVQLSGDRPFEGNYPRWSPDGKWVAFSERKNSINDFRAIYIIPSEGGKIRQITSAPDSVGRASIAFSPDGKNIAFFSNSAIKTIPVEGGQSKVLVADIKFDRWSQLAYSPDGKRIAHCAGGKNIWITSLDEGIPHVLQTGLPKNARQHALSWSPDGKKIAFKHITGGGPEFYLISDFLPKKETASNGFGN